MKRRNFLKSVAVAPAAICLKSEEKPFHDPDWERLKAEMTDEINCAFTVEQACRQLVEKVISQCLWRWEQCGCLSEPIYFTDYPAPWDGIARGWEITHRGGNNFQVHEVSVDYRTLRDIEERIHRGDVSSRQVCASLGYKVRGYIHAVYEGKWGWSDSVDPGDSPRTRAVNVSWKPKDGIFDYRDQQGADRFRNHDDFATTEIKISLVAD